MSCGENRVNKEVSILYALYQSTKGSYYIGQTPTLDSTEQTAMAALVNPCNSKVQVFVNAITVTNSSDQSISAEIYLGEVAKGGISSTLVSSASLCKEPKGQIRYYTSDVEPPCNAVAIFSRIVAPYSTLVIDGGQIILPQNKALTVFLGGFLPVELDTTIVAFGWWEEKDCTC